jgi:hypothetical protein
MPCTVAGSTVVYECTWNCPAVGGVGAPAPGQPQAFADLGAQQRPHHRQQIRAGPLGGHAGDGVAGVLVDIGDPLQHRQALRRSRRRGPTGHSDHSAGHPKPRCAARQAAPNLPRPGMARPAVAPMPELRRCRALVLPAQVFASPAFASWPDGGVLAAGRTAYAPAPDVTGWLEQSQEARSPAAMAGAQAQRRRSRWHRAR